MLALPVLILCIFLLGIPLLSLKQDDAQQNLVMANQEQALTMSAESIASALQERSDLFYKHTEEGAPAGDDIAPPKIIELITPIRLNGDLKDWQPRIESSEIYGEDHLLTSNPDYQPGTLSFRHLAGTQGEYLYAFFDVYDDEVVYRNKNSLRVDRADHLKITIDKKGERKNYIVSTFEPGWVTGFDIPDEPEEIAAHERRIHGNWRRTDTGYRLEIRIQRDLLGDKLIFAVADVDDFQTGLTETLIGTARLADEKEAEEEIVNAEVLKEILNAQKLLNTRFRIVDENGETLVAVGELKKESDAAAREAIQSVSLPREIPAPDIAAVFEGQDRTIRYFRDDGPGQVIAAMIPLYDGNDLVAATITEQAVTYLPPATNQLFRETMSPLIVAFFLGVLGLFLYARRISSAV
ncbi:MAG: hypothetical protein HKP44_04195 [Desulfofustis sp.]|nr:hypothetical protein [Desulfofustis sp.]